MKVIAGGDSFVWGSELAGCGWGIPSPNSFTALLAQNYGFEYVCCAVPGNSNDAVGRIVMDTCEEYKDQDKIVIVSWTFKARFEFHFDYNIDSPRGNWTSINPWNPKETVEEFSKYFFKHVGNNMLYQNYNTLKSILFLQLYLESKGIPYLFTLADNVVYKPEEYELDTSLHNLSKQINWENWYFFPPAEESWLTTTPRGFYQWAVENKYSVGPDKHPLEDAHRDAANLMKEKFNELVTKNL